MPIEIGRDGTIIRDRENSPAPQSEPIQIQRGGTIIRAQMSNRTNRPRYAAIAVVATVAVFLFVILLIALSPKSGSSPGNNAVSGNATANFSLAAAATPQETVHLEDANLEAAIRQQMGVNDDITPEEAAAVSELVITSGNIDSLKGIESFTNLHSLIIDECYGQPASARADYFNSVARGGRRVNKISDFTPLLALKRLDTLVIFCNNYTDLETIGQLVSLKTLRLSGQYIGYQPGDKIDDSDARPDPEKGDLKYLSGLSNLVELDISRNYVRDFTPLQSLTNLRRLNVYNESRHVDYSTLGWLAGSLDTLTKDGDWPLTQ
jgi:hypothetical protein